MGKNTLADIREFGARPDAMNTACIQAAVDAAATCGGKILVPAGEWSTGTIWLKSGVELHLEAGAVLKGSTRQADYNTDDVFPENFHSVGEEWSGAHLLIGYQVENVAITGAGFIDGNGPAFFGDCDEDSRFPWYKYGLKLHPLDREWFRPGPMVAMFLSKNIRLEGVTLRHTPAWAAHFRCCDGLDIRGVTIDEDRMIANGDGFSIDCTRNVVVRDCTVKTGDDGFAIRASCARHAAEHPCENIRIENCDVWSCCYGIRFGVGTGLIRNAEVRHCRFHESAVGIGFTPAWINAKKNVYFENIRVKDCDIRECERAVTSHVSGGDARVKDILFENCHFEALLPCQVHGNQACAPENFVFHSCTYRQIERLKVRHSRNVWDLQHRRRSRVFLETSDFCAGVEAVDCTPGEPGATGILVLSFDDHHLAGWEQAMPLFGKYGAHATFFVSGDIDNAAVRTMKKLAAAGHSVGLHGQTHANADTAIADKGAERYWEEEIRPQSDRTYWAYLRVTSFAYPNCRRTDESDALFYRKGYDRVRGGVPGATPYDPNGGKQAGRKTLATNEAVFFPASELPGRRRLDTIIMGEAYHTDIGEILACIRRAAEHKEVLVITSHDIAPDAKNIHMKTEWLEKMLALAQELKLPVLGFDELPPPA
jgi:peptidoglycan/xylan/chitin deacetylase (PgdA/CDA1 family)